MILAPIRQPDGNIEAQSTYRGHAIHFRYFPRTRWATLSVAGRVREYKTGYGYNLALVWVGEVLALHGFPTVIWRDVK